MGLSGEGTLTAALRELLLRAGNKPSKISALYDQLRSVEKFQRVTKTHIKDKIIRPMVLRGEVGGRGLGIDSVPLSNSRGSSTHR